MNSDHIRRQVTTIAERVNQVLNYFGLHISRFPRARRRSSFKKYDYSYENIITGARYAPWLSDKDFLACFDICKKFTLVDIYRCYELWTLAAETGKLTGDLIEIGVWRGGSGALIAKSARNSGITSPIYLCDTFRGVVKAGEADTSYHGGEHADTDQDTVLRLLDQLNLQDVTVLTGVFPDEIGRSIEDRSIRFCHIDVDVYESAKDIVAWIWPRLVRGGILVYDDFGFIDTPGMTKFVEQWRSRRDSLTIYNLNGHAIAIKIA
jgi:O-methyltransferase